jgi:hypothetical protein
MSEDRLRAAVAAGVVGSEESYRQLLGAIVEVARSIFQAKASSSRRSRARGRRSCSARACRGEPVSPAGSPPPGSRS